MYQLLLPLLLLTGLSSIAKADELVGNHNMLVFGSEAIYMSHLPAYSMVPHRFQGVYEVTFGEENDAKYLAHKGDSNKPLYGIKPTGVFRMPDVKQGFSFTGGLVAGHPEAGLQPFMHTKVTILKVIHFQDFNTVNDRPQDLTYFTVGKTGTKELFLVHWLTTPTVLPSKKDQFDHIVRATANNALGKITEIDEKSWVIFPGRSDSFPQRIHLEKKDPEGFKGIVLSSSSAKTLLFNVLEENRIHSEGDVTIRQ